MEVVIQENYHTKLKHFLPHLCILLPGADLLHFLQDLLGLVHVSLSSELLSLGKELSYFLIQLMNLLCLQGSPEKHNLHLVAFGTKQTTANWMVHKDS